MQPPRDLFGLVGATLAEKYRIERVVGEGGFGVVYAGTHLALGVPIAVKCLKPDAGATPEQREQAMTAFKREARILFTLLHPAIVRLYDSGVTERTMVPYVILELLNGATLADDIRARAAAGRAMTRDDIVALFGPVLDAVALAHERGIVHRDLKPGNVMLVEEGGKIGPRVLDFGTARGDAAATGPFGPPTMAATTTQGLGPFTPLYAAPEQWDGTFGKTGPHTDVFALGLTIAEACMLRAPLGEPESLLSIFRSVTDERRRPALAAVRQDLPVELERVVHKALRVKPEDRYADARAMLAAFRGAMNASVATAPLARPLPTPLRGAPPPSADALAGPSVATPPVHSPPPYAPAPQPVYVATTQSPPRSSPMPWVLGCGALLVAVAALAIVGVFVVRDRIASEPTPAAQPARPPPAPAAATPPPIDPKLPKLVVSDAIGMDPFWTKAEVLGALRTNHGFVAACTKGSAAVNPKLVADVDVTVTPTKQGVVTDTSCNVRGAVRSDVEIALCPCIEEAMGRLKLPPAHGKLGLLDSAPFIVTYRITP